ncbi:hypothetical protein [Nocardioides sp. AE5]|uniref:hypothetical protein n=1 Tax=Nocardioides sp. AE5 TaxID=2962573 RepID=UPI0028820AC8|nr:hypothetical protein [Nocardioides sp. AE5]MDT0202132.1 hypothetical protein [Nocardioides sp. AE5]
MLARVFPLRGPLLALAAVAALVVGFGTGIASVVAHEKSWAWFLVALAAPLSFALALRPGWIRVGFGVGWVGLVLLALQTRPEGDYLVMSSVRGYLLVAGALAMVVTVMATLPLRRGMAESEESTSPT